MKNKFNEFIKTNISSNLGIYFTVTLFFAIGLAAGAFTVRSIDIKQKEELVAYFNRFLQILDRQTINNYSVLVQTFKNNLQVVLLIWFLGITVVGIPITILIIAFRGFMLGFTISFLIQGMGWKGIFLTMLALIPQNIIYITCLIIICTYSLTFSLQVLKAKIRSSFKINFKKNILSYTVYIVVLFIVMCLGGLIEAYISPYVIRALSSYITVQ